MMPTRHPRIFVVEYLLLLLLVSPSCQSLNILNKLPPHAGYHGKQSTKGKNFFEGWYLRLTTDDRDSLAFIFHVFDPYHSSSDRRSVGVQILLPSGRYFTRCSRDLYRFTADDHELQLRNLFRGNGDYFDVTSCRVRGQTTNTTSAHDHDRVVYDFDVRPLLGWGGGAGQRQYSTAGWLAAVPRLFDPHYQVLISQGLASGSVQVFDDDQNVVGHRYDFTDAHVYLEKNWGGNAFPSQWWWIQANRHFYNDAQQLVDLTVTSTGGRRRLPWNNKEEEVALVGLHYQGVFYPFPTIDWSVQWGQWKVQGTYRDTRVRLTGTCRQDDMGIPVQCPTASGMQTMARETFVGYLRVELWQGHKVLVNATSTTACLEIGGATYWDADQIWRGESAMAEPLKSVAMNRDLNNIGSLALHVLRRFVDIPGL